MFVCNYIRDYFYPPQGASAQDILYQEVLNDDASSSATPSVSLESLPDEILLDIAERLNLKDLLSLGSTTRKIKRVAEIELISRAEEASAVWDRREMELSHREAKLKLVESFSRLRVYFAYGYLRSATEDSTRDSFDRCRRICRESCSSLDELGKQELNWELALKHMNQLTGEDEKVYRAKMRWVPVSFSVPFSIAKEVAEQLKQNNQYVCWPKTGLFKLADDQKPYYRMQTLGG